MFILIASCNNAKKEEQQKKEKQLEESILRRVKDKKDFTDHFVVILDILAKQEDNFQLFYTEDYLLNFSVDQMLTKSFQGAENFQKVVFHLPKNVFPDRYRFDVGSNTNLKELKIKSLTIRYGKNEIVISQKLIKDYLMPNIYIEHDDASNIYYLKSVNSKGVLPYDPYFTCSPQFVRLLLDL